MKSHNITLFIFIITFAQLSNSAEVQLPNGDLLHGEIIEHKEGQITLQHPSLGLLTLSNATIKPSAQKTIDSGLFKTGLLANWKREVEIGIKGNEGNSRNLHIHTGTRLTYEGMLKRWDIELAYDSSEDSGEASRNEFFTRFNRDFLIPNATHFYFTEGRYDWDEFEDWDYRLSFGGGLGYQLIKTNHWIVNSRSGFGTSKEFGGKNPDWTPEGILSIESNWAITERHSLEFKNTLYPSFKDAGEFRNTSALNWKIGLDQLNGIDLKIGLKNEFDSNTSGDSRKNDFKYNLSLVLAI